MTPKLKATEIKSGFLNKITESNEVSCLEKIHSSFSEGLAIDCAILAAEMVREEIKHNVGTYAEENRVFWHEVIVELIKMK